MRENKTFYEEPLIQSFFNIPKNKDLLLKKINHLDDDAAQELDVRFAIFFLKVRMTSYTNKLTRHYSKEFDKKRRIQRYQLQLDKPVEEESEHLVSKIDSNEPDVTDIFSRDIYDILPTIQMKQIFNQLSFEKKLILHYFTFHDLNNKEIAKEMSCSPQNVSKLKKNALKDLKGAEKNESRRK